MYHNPVLLHDCINGLNINPNGIYVDATFGGGGHSKEILSKLDNGKLIAFDQDEEALENKIEDERLILINRNFSYLKNFLQLYNLIPIDGILADLGISSHQIDNAPRGFTFRENTKLDMRMDCNSPKTAADIINTYSSKELIALFKEYGEISNAAFLSNLIVEARKEKTINMVDELIEKIKKAIDKKKENQYLAKIFQALRIEVNDELTALKKLLQQSLEVLKPNGRMVFLSYHSLEDRLVKNFFKSGNFEGNIDKDFYGNTLVPFRLINKKPIVPSEEEIKANNRARSAKLRIAEKI